MRYWFRPQKFFKYFAAYYPTSWQGWVVTIVLVVALMRIFVAVDVPSHSISDTLINFAPFAVIIFLIFDLLCFRKGEYPSWWRDRTDSKKYPE